MVTHDWLDCLLRANRVIELRHQRGDRWHSGLFDDPGPLRRVIRELQDAGNLYTTIARPRPCITATNAMNAQALRDADMGLRTLLPFDFDPVRPTGVASTDAELQAALHVRNRFAATLLGQGWPAGAMACSGNGAHLVYRVHMPVTAEASEMLAVLYRGLEADFSTELVTFDPTVRNPARIWRLYGSRNSKGTATPDRPHRIAQVGIPARWEPVSPRMVAALAESYARRVREHQPTMHHTHMRIEGVGDYSTLNAVDWFASHGAYGRELSGGKHAVRCPWADQHSSEPTPHDTSTVIWETTGSNWPTFHCSHKHCEVRDIRDVLALWGDADRFCSRAWRKA
jgi:hypothetical protein